MGRTAKKQLNPAGGEAIPGSCCRHSVGSIRRGEGGFTLLEILLAIFIFAIIITTIFGSFNAVFSGSAAMEQDLDIYELGKTGVSRMIMDLQSLQITLLPEYKPPQFNDPPDPFRFVLTPHATAGADNFPQLRFTSSSHAAMGENPRNGIAEIIYYVQATEEGEYILRRSDTLYPYQPFEAKASDPALCEQVKALEFKLYDQTGSEYDHWDSESDEFKHATPRGISIRLEIGEEAASFVFETKVALPVFRKEVEKTF